MAFRDVYHQQVALLVRVLPLVAEEHCFALKGGTAINLFHRDMPRLSVDIDLTYLPVAPRQQSLTEIHAAMLRIAGRVSTALPGAQVQKTMLRPEGTAVKLIVRDRGVQIKIEVTPVLRGCVFETERRAVRAVVEDAYGFAEIQTVSFADLYAGKLVAALDRQHPRDLFDVRELLANEGIGDDLRRAFVVYLISHNRPIAEVLDPVRQPLHGEFSRGFDGMTAIPVNLTELEETRESMISILIGGMPTEHRRFLLSFDRGEPEWQLLGLLNSQHLPAVLWRQLNLNSLPVEARSRQTARLESVLGERGTRSAGG